MNTQPSKKQKIVKALKEVFRLQKKEQELDHKAQEIFDIEMKKAQQQKIDDIKKNIDSL